MKGETMELEFLQDEPKLILTYPHKAKFNGIGWASVIALSVMILWLLKYLMVYNTDSSDKIIIAIVLIYSPLLIWFIGYYLFINGVKLEIYKNNIVQYYTYNSRGHSVLHYQFKLQDIEQVAIKKSPFNCTKLSMQVRNPIFCGLHVKKLNRLANIHIVTDRLRADIFIQEMDQFQKDNLGNQVIK